MIEVRTIPPNADVNCDNCNDPIELITYGGGVSVSMTARNDESRSSSTVTLTRHTFICTNCARILLGALNAQLQFLYDERQRKQI